MRIYRGKNPVRTNSKVVRILFEHMHTQRITEAEMAERVGYSKDTLRDWRTRTNPRVNDLENCLNYLGYELHVRPLKD